MSQPWISRKRAYPMAESKAIVIKNPLYVKRRNRVPKVKGAIPVRTELKFNDVDLTAGSVCDTTGLATPLNLIAVGDENTTRDGRQVVIKSVQVRGIVKPVDDAVATTLCRCMLVWDNANSSVATTSANFIAALLTASSSNAFPLVNNQNRFTILWDSYYAVGGTTNTATQAVSLSPNVHEVSHYRRMQNVTQYSLGTAVIEGIQNGALWFVTLGDQAAGLGGTFTGRIRVRFIDQ